MNQHASIIKSETIESLSSNLNNLRMEDKEMEEKLEATKKAVKEKERMLELKKQLEKEQQRVQELEKMLSQNCKKGEQDYEMRANQYNWNNNKDSYKMIWQEEEYRNQMHDGEGQKERAISTSQPLFYGKSEEDVEDWFLILDNNLNIANIPRRKRVCYALMYMREIALQAHKKIIKEESDIEWDEYKHRIIRQFKRYDKKQQMLKKLLSLRQGCSSINEFLDIFFPVLNECENVHEDMKIQILQNAVKDDIGFEIMKKGPTTLEEAIGIARMTDRFLTKKEDEVRFAIDFEAARRFITCAKCKEKGHIESECRGPVFRYNGERYGQARDWNRGGHFGSQYKNNQGQMFNRNNNYQQGNYYNNGGRNNYNNNSSNNRGSNNRFGYRNGNGNINFGINGRSFGNFNGNSSGTSRLNSFSSGVMNGSNSERQILKPRRSSLTNNDNSEFNSKRKKEEMDAANMVKEEQVEEEHERLEQERFEQERFQQEQFEQDHGSFEQDGYEYAQTVLELGWSATQQNTGRQLRVKGTINDIETEMVIDTGATVSIISKDDVVRFGLKHKTSDRKLKLADGKVVDSYGTTVDTLVIVNNVACKLDMVILPFRGISILLGADWQVKLDVTINMKRALVLFGASSVVAEQVQHELESDGEEEYSSDTEKVLAIQALQEEEEIFGENQPWDDVKELEVPYIETITPGENLQIKALIEEFEDVFALSVNTLRKPNIKIKHHIRTIDNFPVYTPQYRTSKKEDEIALERTTTMLKLGVCHMSRSPYNSPFLALPKKDSPNEYRFAIDFRKLNKKTITDPHPIPRINDIFDATRGSKLFTLLDLVHGYWQIELDEESREKTAFSTKDGHFEFLRMPFGF